MKKIALFVLCLLCSVSLFANVIEGVAAIPEGYYDDVNGKKTPATILSALQTCISRNYKTISYDGLEPHYQQTDFYADTLWDMYSTCRFTADDANIPQKAVCDGWNKEHVCCQSWLGSGPMVSDMFNVYPTDARINNLRSNYPYGVVSSFSGFSKDPDHHGLGKLGSSVTSGVGTVYEPDDRYKGDFARTFFYMVARYRDKVLNSGNGATMFTSNPTDLTSYSLNFLLAWHRNDPVSQKEIDRNQGVYGEQHNRNPFIDYPDLVEYIWGNKQNQTVDLSTMTPTCDNQIVPTNTKYGVSWSVNGTVLFVDSIQENKTVRTLPETPESCSATSNLFVGWTTAPIATPTDLAPTLFGKPSDFPAVTADVTYYAVFAHGEQQQGQGSVTASTDFSSYSRGNAVSSEQIGNITVTFAKEAAGTATTYYTEVRCYAGSTLTFTGAQMSQIAFTAGTNDKGNALTPNTGTMMNDNTWTGSASSVTFTVGGDSGYRGIGGISVTYEDNTIVYIYSDYLTHCGLSGIENQQPAVTNRKLLIDGRLYILVGESLYDITGQLVR